MAKTKTTFSKLDLQKAFEAGEEFGIAYERNHGTDGKGNYKYGRASFALCFKNWIRAFMK